VVSVGFDVQTRQKVVAELEWWENWGMWRAASEENMNICHHLSAGLLWWFLILAKGHAGLLRFGCLGLATRCVSVFPLLASAFFGWQRWM